MVGYRGNNMRILFTIGTMGGGGAERNVSLLANALIEKGYEVGIMGIWGDELAYQLSPLITYIPIEPNASNKLIRFAKQLFRIRPYIKKYNPDVILSFLADVNACVLLCTRFMKCKVVVSERNDPNIDPTIKAFRILRKIMYHYADAFVFQTMDAKEYFNKTIRNKVSYIIPNPVRKDLPVHIDKETGIIATACRLTKQKNIPLLIDAYKMVLKQHPEYVLYIYGEGELKDELSLYVSQQNLNENVFLKGFVQDVCERINEADIFALSSDYEGMSNSMLEALGMGMPCVITDCPIGGARMLIKNMENGVLVPTGDKEALANALLLLINDEEKREELGRAALQIRRDNSIEQIVEKWTDLICQIGEGIDG